MALNPLNFQTPEAYSSFDFSPLAKLGQQLQQQQEQKNLADLAARYGYGSPNVAGQSQPAGTAPANAVATMANRGAYASPYTGNKQDVAKSVATELRSQGFSEPAIAGMLYNISQESGFDPTMRHSDQPHFGGEAHYAHGLFQEGGDEWNTMSAHLGPQGNWQDPVQQARFVAGRLKGEIGNNQYSEVMRGLNAAKTPEEAAKIFARGYLKPADRYLASRFSDINRGIPSIGFYTGE